jgi:hypothetical protein
LLTAVVARCHSCYCAVAALQVSLSRVFSAMAGLRAAELGVVDWAVANATMEEVFIRITQQMNIKAAE